MKFIQLLTSAYVNGRMRHPHEGVLHLEDDEANRLVDNQSGKDVTSDFDAEQRKETPVERLTGTSTDAIAAAALAPVEHQSVANAATTSDAAPADVAKPKKEGTK